MQIIFYFVINEIATYTKSGLQSIFFTKFAFMVHLDSKHALSDALSSKAEKLSIRDSKYINVS